MRGAIRTGIAVIGMLGVVAAGPAAGAHDGGHDGGAIARGSCSGESHWSLKAVKLDHVIGVRFRVVTGVNEQVWKVAMAHNRHLIFWGRRVTGDPDGSFAVRRLVRNAPGIDIFRAGAWNRETGEFCRARLGI